MGASTAIGLRVDASVARPVGWSHLLLGRWDGACVVVGLRGDFAGWWRFSGWGREGCIGRLGSADGEYESHEHHPFGDRFIPRLGPHELMMRSPRRCVAAIVMATFIVQTIFPASAAPPIVEKFLAPLKRHGRAPQTCVDPCVEELAANIDWLEHNIDRYGSIVAKTPDVWGEARLTKYRREVEEQLAKQVSAFKPTLNGAAATRDLAMLAAAISFGEGASEEGFGDLTTISIDQNGIQPQPPTLGKFGLIGGDDLFAYDTLELEPVTRLDQMRRYLDHLNELRRINEGDDAADAPGYSLNLIRIPVSVLPGTKTTHGHGAEITMTASMQLPDHLLADTYRDLVINDLVDQLSLPMTRFLNSDPVRVAGLLNAFNASENPDKAIAAFADLTAISPLIIDDVAVTEAIKQVLGENGIDHHSDLKNFIFDDGKIRLFFDRYNRPGFEDLQSQMRIYATYVRPVLAALQELNRVPSAKVLDQVNGCPKTPIQYDCDRIIEANEILLGYGLQYDFNERGVYSLKFGSIDKARANLEELLKPLYQNDQTLFGNDNALNEHIKKGLKAKSDAPLAPPQERITTTYSLDAGDSTKVPIRNKQPTIANVALAAPNAGPGGVIASDIASHAVDLQGRDLLQGLTELTASLTTELKEAAATTTIPTSLSRRSTLPYPPSELIEILGELGLGWLVLEAHEAFRVDAINRSVVHLVDVQAFLREELTSAYDMLSRPELLCVWEPEIASPTLAGLVRGHRHVELTHYRDNFMANLPPGIQREPVAVLAWAVMVESVLLNERMNQAINKQLGAGYCTPEMPTVFFGPHPSPEAIETFNSFVAARWPLRVFTIDPVSTDQNISDTAAIARQMQFAAAFAVATGEARPAAGLNFARNIQRDFATVALNQTAVGFVHGNDTFGWRFQPRFQTPPVQNNGVVIVRDLIIGGPTDNALRRQRRIEPGMRECVAVVLTPSFVTGITVDTRSNWYGLNKPGRSAISMRELTKQSRSITAMRHAAECCVRRPDYYRDGEIARMLRRVDQLDRELPLQTLHCQVPNSNTLGGFEILSGGVRELAPELLGWYGSPGYTPGVDDQTFYLVGDNFSVHETEVIAGTRKPSDTKLLSRQIIEVTLPGNIPVIRDGRLGRLQFPAPDASNTYDGYIDAHVATPYGVSGHLLIPVLSVPTPPKPATPTVASPPAGAAIPVRVSMKQKDGIYTVASDMIPTVDTLASVTIPRTIPTAAAGLTGATTDVTITPTAEGNPLSPVTLSDLPITGGIVQINTPEILTAFDAKGSMHASLARYVEWRMSNAFVSDQPTFAKLQSDGIPVKLKFSLAAGGTPVPVGGDVSLSVVPTIQ